MINEVNTPETKHETKVRGSSWKEAITKVTPLSKYLSIVLFIVLPFAGFWLGHTQSTQNKTITSNFGIDVQSNKSNRSVTWTNCPKDIQKATEDEFGIINTHSCSMLTHYVDSGAIHQVSLKHGDPSDCPSGCIYNQIQVALTDSGEFIRDFLFSFPSIYNKEQQYGLLCTGIRSIVPRDSTKNELTKQDDRYVWKSTFNNSKFIKTAPSSYYADESDYYGPAGCLINGTVYLDALSGANDDSEVTVEPILLDCNTLEVKEHQRDACWTDVAVAEKSTDVCLNHTKPKSCIYQLYKVTNYPLSIFLVAGLETKYANFLTDATAVKFSWSIIDEERRVANKSILLDGYYSKWTGLSSEDFLSLKKYTKYLLDSWYSVETSTSTDSGSEKVTAHVNRNKNTGCLSKWKEPTKENYEYSLYCGYLDPEPDAN